MTAHHVEAAAVDDTAPASAEALTPESARPHRTAPARRSGGSSSLRRHALTSIVILLVAAGAAWAVTAITPPTYDSQATIQLRVQTDGEAVSVTEASSLATSEAATYAALATTQSVLDPAIRRAGVDIDSADLAQRVQAETVPLTTLITIDVRADTARDAAELASAVATTLAERAQSDSAQGGQAVLTGTVVTDPVVPDEPASPSLLLNLAVGLAVGLAVAGAVVAIRESPARSRAAS